MFTCLLTITADGGKKIPCTIFRGKGVKLSAEEKEMHKRRDIKIFYSSNGWANQKVINDWINYMFPTTSFSKKILIWDSFAAHISDETKKLLKTKRVLPIVIPGGCTYLLQTLDASNTC